GYSAFGSLSDRPAGPGAGHPSTAGPPRGCPGHGALSSAPQDSRSYAGARASRLRRVLARTCRQGDNDGMARDDDMAYLRSAVLRYLDGARPSTTRIWVDLAAPVVIQAAAGAGHWAAGRRQRALAEWAGASGWR